MSPFTRLSTLLCALTFGLCPPAAAQQGDFQWAAMPAQNGVVAGVGICPVRQASQIQCLLLYCTAERALHLNAYWTGAGVPTDAVTGALTVNGTVMLSGPMTRFPTAPPGVELGLPFTGDDYDRIALELMSGGFVSLAIQDGTGSLTIGAPLGGIAPGLRGARDMCAFATPAPIIDPVAGLMAQERANCAAMGAQAVFDESFATQEDLNADGRPDVVVNYGGVQCQGMGGMNCGSAGCPTTFFLAVDGGYLELGGGFMRGFEAQVRPTLTFYLHGSACGRVGVETCIVTNEITSDGRLKEIGRQ